MDFAVNQKTDGLFLYRMHDDLWLWDSNHGKVAAGWLEMNRYASVVGLKINVPMTGSACIGGNNPDLPPGDVRWGFLKFEPALGRFVIDQKYVDKEIKELHRQLSATKSIFGWVNVYNKYMAYFVRNFGGRPAGCFGRSHTDDMIETLARIEHKLFPGRGGAIGHLRSMIKKRFGVGDLPQGYFYFPIGTGGLQVHNPLIELLSIRENIVCEPGKVFEEEMEKDVEVYKTLKEKWEASNVGPRFVGTIKEEFVSFEAYIAQRETGIGRWRTCYGQLLNGPFVMDINLTPAVNTALQDGRLGYSSVNWQEMDFYRKWIVALYGDEVVKTFGGLEIVDPSLIPVGLVQLFQGARMKLDQ
jgi:hypothetical protein